MDDGGERGAAASAAKLDDFFEEIHGLTQASSLRRAEKRVNVLCCLVIPEFGINAKALGLARGVGGDVGGEFRAEKLLEQVGGGDFA